MDAFYIFYSFHSVCKQKFVETKLLLKSLMQKAHKELRIKLTI